MVPILTIPETAYEAAGYTANRRRSRLLTFLVKLTNGSAILITAVYLVCIFGIRPLLEIGADRRLELLEKFRGNLRDCYLSLVGRVSYIPIVAINKNDGSGKLYADAVCQTASSHMSGSDKKRADEEEAMSDKLNQNKLVTKLTQLSSSLSNCTAYLVTEIPHYKTIRYCVKDFQNKADSVYFKTHDIFTTTVEGAAGARKKNIVTDIKHEIRSMKGMYISGKVS